MFSAGYSVSPPPLVRTRTGVIENGPHLACSAPSRWVQMKFKFHQNGARISWQSWGHLSDSPTPKQLFSTRTQRDDVQTSIRTSRFGKHQKSKWSRNGKVRVLPRERQRYTGNTPHRSTVRIVLDLLALVLTTRHLPISSCFLSAHRSKNAAHTQTHTTSVKRKSSA